MLLSVFIKINGNTYPQVIPKPSRSRNQQIHTLHQLLLLRSPVRASNTDPKRLRMVLHQVPRDTEDLQRQLARGGDDDDARAVHGLKLEPVEELDGGDEECERLAGPCAGGAEHVFACEEDGDRLGLHGGHGCHAHLCQGAGCL